VERLETFSNSKGAHEWKLGSVISRTGLGGGFSFKPVEIWNRDWERIERIEFTAGAPFRISDTEEALFAQDHFRLFSNLTLDGGARVEHQSRNGTLRFAPRFGAAWIPFREARTVVRGGF